MKAKDLAYWLLKNPELDVYVVDHVNLLELNTITDCGVGDKCLFDKNDDNGMIKLKNNKCIKYNKFNKDIIILSNQINYKEEE